jgi:hypothetical protein
LTATDEVEKMVGLKSPDKELDVLVPSATDNDRALSEIQQMMGGVRR